MHCVNFEKRENGCSHSLKQKKTLLSFSLKKNSNRFGYDTIPNPKWTPASPKSVQRYTPYPRFKGDDRIIEQAKLLFSKQWLATFKWRDFVM